jgi:maltose alpha-D-glucosyltransferase / alpha-amylase
MGARVAQLHLILATQFDDPAFAAEPFNDFYRQSLYHGYLGLTGRRLEFIRQRYSDMREDMRVLASKVLEQENAIVAKLAAVFQQRIYSERTRFHGRLHLGHLLIHDQDVVIFDFEGDPEQHISERRIKRTPLRDVTSMLVSLGYAAQAAFRQTASANLSGDLTTRQLRNAVRFWYSHISAAFIRGYWSIAGNAAYLPTTRADQQTLLQTYLLERALLDVRADVEDKPELAGMPFRIILHLLDPEAERKTGE